MAKKKDTCMQRKIRIVMRENKNKPSKQRIAIALSVARKHCGKKR
ncbi:hypothetical protein LCGC14_0687680 [marine sediment metagenome]|uniref:Uncharacterized protein n=1 Tax=marine sediment metagenome TaxID=412755 RepID=A0A0F9R6T0_9ZZZZ